MAVVSDTSPLRYFAVTGHVDLLRQVLGPLVIPRLVLSELTHPSAPEAVRNWCSALPNWVSVLDPRDPPDISLVRRLDAGEAAAIQLAGELKADVLLIDERIGRAEAARRGIPVVGTLGVLREGFRRGLVADPLAIVSAMRSGGFRVSKRLIDEFQRRVESIRQAKQAS
jgi:predicted nucleic acid-binding protein